MYHNDKRLGFLLSLMDVLGISKIRLAEMMGVSSQSIFSVFRRDDMKLSRVEEILDRMGFEASVRLERKGDNMKEIICGIENLLHKDELRRLTFLKIAFKKYGIEKDDVAQKMDFNVAGVFRWFRVDDILISHLYEIARMYDLELVVDLRRK